jgi:hypothetical protein
MQCSQRRSRQNRKERKNTMLRNYAHHAQSPKSWVHSVHKMQSKAIWQILTKLSYRLSFVRPCLQSHIYEAHVDRSFFRRERSMQSTWSAGLSGLSGLVSKLSGRNVHEIVHGHAHVQTNPVNSCACTCAHMHKTDLPIAPNKRHARYFIDTDETRFPRETFSIAAHRLKFLCTLRNINRSYVHNSAA